MLVLASACGASLLEDSLPVVLVLVAACGDSLSLRFSACGDIDSAVRDVVLVSACGDFPLAVPFVLCCLCGRSVRATVRSSCSVFLFCFS